MNYQEIKAKIRQNLTNYQIEELRVQPDPFGGWRIAIVSSDFRQKSQRQRKGIALKDLDNLEIEWLDLLTPEEKEWAGNLPLDSTLEDLPFWPEALARSSQTSPKVVFPSDLDEDIDLPIITTFYSLRGGVGRSTALAYTGQILARRGKTVLCVDMDLEAPGLAALFGKEAEMRSDQGLVSLLIALDQGTKPNIQEHLLRISETEELYCLPAGKPSANYARLLNLIAPEAWYREDRNPLRELIDLLGTQLTFKPDVILIDARTGMTPLNAPLLFDLADLAMIVFFPHPQTQSGTEALVKALLSTTTRRKLTPKLTPEPRFIVSPIPASKAPEVITRYQRRSLKWIQNWLSSLDRSPGMEIDENDITQFIPYQEVIATSDQVLRERDIWQDFEPVADWIEGLIPTRTEQQLQPETKTNLAAQKPNILKDLTFSGGTAEEQDPSLLIETFVNTELIERALHPQNPLVLGRKGTGKTAIFRRISEGRQRPSIIVMSPSSLKKDNFWILSSDGFKEIEKIIKESQLSWREFWILQTGLAYYCSNPETPILPEPELAQYLNKNLNSDLQIINFFENILQINRIGLFGRDWLEKIDREIAQETILLFDGLDTGFGNNEEDRNRRKQSIEDLLSLVNELSDNLQKLKFKVLLREDIWRSLKFDNKSHFYGRSVTLSWDNQADFFQIVIKRALRSESFKTLIHSIMGQQLLKNSDYWIDSQIFAIWNILVGERMKGAKSAFTRNWVWNRLADGSNNRNPRALLQLFDIARQWEMKEHSRNAYSKTLIRPSALTKSLKKVSKQVLDALIQEEFIELQPLVEQLQKLGYSPFKGDDITGLDSELQLALEVGLLERYDETPYNVQRYKVPDIYRLGIGMTRKGQA